MLEATVGAVASPCSADSVSMNGKIKKNTAFKGEQYFPWKLKILDGIAGFIAAVDLWTDMNTGRDL